MTSPLSEPRILKVALDVPLDALFDYLDGGHTVMVGQRVIVPFGRRHQVGIVAAVATHSDFPLDKLKPILQAFCAEPALDAETFALLRFCADYYQYPYGQALLSMLPARLRQTEPATTRRLFAYSLTLQGRAAGLDALPKRALAQRRLYDALQQAEALDDAALAALSPGWRKHMQVLVQAGLAEAQEVVSYPSSTVQAALSPGLNPAQAQALQAILSAPSGFKSWLLHGITGSGKTEVYIRLIEQMLADNDGQALVLVPEINLTPQLEARFRSRLPQFPLVALHSNLGESERLQNWRLAQSGQARIVIGTRLAVFTPMPRLRLLIIDEEHDGSYKQQDGMRYHARDVALVRAQRLRLPAVLGSATPALETWHNAQTEKFGLLSLAERAVAQSVLPTVRCINVAHSEMEDGLSPVLIAAIRERLARGEQSLLFINRRGYAPVLLCPACSWAAPCSRCSSRLVVHLRQGRLRCHHCGHEERIVRACPSCGNQDLLATGHGTQRLEQTLAKLFPEARILRVDRDSTRRKGALNDMLTAVHAGEVDILIGTQMLAKGHDFPNLTLVGVVDTDSALFSPDFRAAERLFAQLMQVAGRAGRAAKAGEVLIQTVFPDHALFNALREQDYAAYAQALLHERELMHFPPYSYLAVLKAEAKDFALVSRFLRFAADTAHSLGEEGVLTYDPVRPQMERLKGMERGQLLLQATNRQPLQRLLRTLVASLREHPLSPKIRWAVDVDALEF